MRDFRGQPELMQAVDYIVQKAEMLQMPVSVNISFGNTYGAHNGTSLPERFLDAAAQIGRTLISVGTGNEGAEAGHTSGFVREGEETSVAAWSTGTSGSIQSSDLDGLHGCDRRDD